MVSEGLTAEQGAEQKRKAADAYTLRISQDPTSLPTSPTTPPVASSPTAGPGAGEAEQGACGGVEIEGDPFACEQEASSPV